MMRLRLFFSTLSCLVCLSGCASSVNYDYSPSDEQRLLGEITAGTRLPARDVLYLDEQTRALIDERIDSDWNQFHKLRELRKYLFSKDELNISYDSQDTRTAMETFSAQSGNCLSMTNLFIAAARYVGLSAQFQTVEVRPSWDYEGGTMIRYEHIVATGKLPRSTTYVIDFFPEFVLDEYKSAPVTDRIALSLYYNNLGAENLLDGRPKEAIAFLQTSLQLREDASDTWSNMGAAMRRVGRHDLAEFSYLKAIHQNSRNFSAQNNLVSLYKFQGRDAAAGRLEKRVQRYRDRNPYFHYFVANVLLESGRYEDAAVRLERSIRLKRNEPDFYETLARTYASLGNTKSSERMAVLADKYKNLAYVEPDMEMNHRYWTEMIQVVQ